MCWIQIIQFSESHKCHKYILYQMFILIHATCVRISFILSWENCTSLIYLLTIHDTGQKALHLTSKRSTVLPPATMNPCDVCLPPAIHQTQCKHYNVWQIGIAYRKSVYQHIKHNFVSCMSLTCVSFVWWHWVYLHMRKRKISMMACCNIYCTWWGNWH